MIYGRLLSRDFVLLHFFADANHEILCKFFVAADNQFQLTFDRREVYGKFYAEKCRTIWIIHV